ncbi:MAG: Hsp20/alpha crystallin family protein [Proteobacteria bacterium]|nr:Hsp20/alpha crystallin family protein [Pseudomonadota bacterium]MBU1233876.1 Hsp20/alpha crystallin family protein [Pseudomonadota bacterium]MBU1419888.1 Hsp20/alpha crystallin family protein [Pseudomonadota bacterium]MBU1454012.1 Hsp20/alpha crystallin family protein [Pseudomonadota bacterium]
MGKEKAELVVKKEEDVLSPFGEMERYFDEIFHQPFSFFGYPKWPQMQVPSMEVVAPTVDVFEEGKEVVVRAELPGIKKSDITIDISENRMTISGEKKQEKKIDKKDYHRVECSYGSFRRTFRLPENVNSDEANASFKDGVLEIRMPTSGKAQKKKIAIK